jgi:hypothetical protein
MKSAALNNIPISLEKSFTTELKAAPFLFNSSTPSSPAGLEFSIVKNS